MPPNAHKKGTRTKKLDKPPNMAKAKTINKKQERLDKVRRQRWVMAGIIVVIGIVANFYMGKPDSKSKAVPDEESADFIQGFVCEATGAVCDPSLVPHRRSQMAAKNIPGKKALIKIPRALQIWDLDALRGVWIQQELKDARHNYTHNAIDSGAFLAAYLIHRFILEPDEHDPLLRYYEILPSFRQLARHHPTLWDTQELQTLINSRTTSFAVIKAYMDMIESEYNAFAAVSDIFKEEVNRNDYVRMRVLVMSRSFGTGKPNGVPEEEFQKYQDEMGIDLTKGCRAMVPLLDMYNHHAKPNVEWKYDVTENAFIVSSVSDGIPAGQEILNSYGTYTDSHLFAKFGFVNGDGSGYTQASIAVFHRLFDMGLMQQFSYLPTHETVGLELEKQQKLIMSRYLQFDDGYSHCIQNAADMPEAYTLKQWKLKHLLRYANRPSSWILHMKPRNKDAKPSTSFDKPTNTKVPLFDFKNLDFDGSKLMSLCRLISLTWEDYEGKAIQTLKSAYESSSKPFTVKHQTPHLEYRALLCLARFSGIGLSRYGKDFNLGGEIARVEALNQNSWGSAQWAAGHVQLGEYMTLDLLYRIAHSGAKEYSERLSPEDQTNDAMNKIAPIRVHPCEWNYTEALANNTFI